MLDLGHTVFLFRLDKFTADNQLVFRSQRYREKLAAALVKTFREEHYKNPFDLFFSYLTDRDIAPDIVKQIKSSSVPVANFSCNNTHQFYLTQHIAPFIDFNLHSEKNAREKFLAIGANPVWLQMAANPTYYFPQQTGKKYEVSFVGMNYARRAYYISSLLENNINVSCFGPGWILSGKTKFRKETKRKVNLFSAFLTAHPEKRYMFSSALADYDFSRLLIRKFPGNFYPPPSDEQVLQIYNQSAINLGFLEVYGRDNNSFTQLEYHLHLREFEIPMAGGLYCTNYCEELAEFYEPDKEVIVFGNEHELRDKINYYLKYPARAENIRKAGYLRALQEHTSQERLRKLFIQLKLD